MLQTKLFTNVIDVLKLPFILLGFATRLSKLSTIFKLFSSYYMCFSEFPYSLLSLDNKLASDEQLEH